MSPIASFNGEERLEVLTLSLRRTHIHVVVCPVSVTVHAVSQRIQDFNASYINKLSAILYGFDLFNIPQYD